MRFLPFAAVFYCGIFALFAGASPHDGASGPLSAKAADTIVAWEERGRQDAEFSYLERLRSFAPKKHFRHTQGGHKLVFNRISAPVLPRQNRQLLIREAAPMSLEGFLEAGAKTIADLNFSATIYDEQITELVLYDQGKKLHVFVNINFLHLQGVGQFETADTVYGVFMTPYSGDWQPKGDDVPALEDFPANGIEFLLAGDSELTFGDKAFGGIDALCRHYLQHKAAFEAAHQRRTALEEARERYQKNHPEKPKEIIFNFWKE